MSSETVIRVNRLGKAYEMYQNPQDRLKQFLWRGWKSFYTEVHALRGVSFEVRKGEIFSIIGRNGSGKSTLLQVITGILQHTSGEVVVNGRVAALLELGAGLNLEFTGRENVHFNGALVGMSKEDIGQRFDDIVSFAELEAFIDQPVKTYSTGMMLRLAFAVATNIDADILIVDEALAVGDEAFQRKCFHRIEQFRSGGGTIVFVSHSADMVIELSDRTLLLDAGERLLLSPPKEAISRYHRLVFAPPDKVESIRDEIRSLDGTLIPPPDHVDQLHVRIGGQVSEDEVPAENGYDQHLMPKSTVKYVSLGATISDIHFENEAGERINLLEQGQLYYYVYDVEFSKPAFNARFGMLVKNVLGVQIGGLTSHLVGDGVEFIPEGRCMRVRFAIRNRLTAGTYFTNAGVLGIVDGGEQYLHRILDGAIFRVPPDENSLATALVDLSDRTRIWIDEIAHADDDQLTAEDGADVQIGRGLSPGS